MEAALLKGLLGFFWLDKHAHQLNRLWKPLTILNDSMVYRWKRKHHIMTYQSKCLQYLTHIISKPSYTKPSKAVSNLHGCYHWNNSEIWWFWLGVWTSGIIFPYKTIWLVVYLPLWKIMEFVTWDDDIPNWMEKWNSCSKPPIRQYSKNIYFKMPLNGLHHTNHFQPPSHETSSPIMASTPRSWGYGQQNRLRGHVHLRPRYGGPKIPMLPGRIGLRSPLSQRTGLTQGYNLDNPLHFSWLHGEDYDWSVDAGENGNHYPILSLWRW